MIHILPAKRDDHTIFASLFYPLLYSYHLRDLQYLYGMYLLSLEETPIYSGTIVMKYRTNAQRIAVG